MSDITVGIMGIQDGTGFPSERRVYIELDGRIKAYVPARAREMAAKFRTSGMPDLVELADDIDALALEIETGKGTA